MSGYPATVVLGAWGRSVSAPLCRCGHSRYVHEHWRVAEDCGLCGPDRCPTYRRSWPRLQRVADRVLYGRVGRPRRWAFRSTALRRYNPPTARQARWVL